MGTLEFGHDPQDRDQETQVRREGRLEHKLPVGQFLDPRVDVVDGPVTVRQPLDLLAIAAQQGIGRPRHVVGDHAEQFDDLGFDSLKLMVEYLPMVDHSQSLSGGDSPLRDALTRK
jgi:hypothetical protein